MHVSELWRYPIKTLKGERIQQTEITANGIPGDREIVVMGKEGRIITSRSKPKLLGLRGELRADGVATVNGHPWDSPEALALVNEAAGGNTELVKLRERCVMTTYDPDTQVQDRSVLVRIVQQLDGTTALDSAVITPGVIHVGDEAEIL